MGVASQSLVGRAADNEAVALSHAFELPPRLKIVDRTIEEAWLCSTSSKRGQRREAQHYRVKPDEKLMILGERQQTSCCSTSITSWSASAERRGGGGGGGGGGGAVGRDVQLAGVDLGLVLIQTVGEEMAKIEQERNQWLHRMSGS